MAISMKAGLIFLLVVCSVSAIKPKYPHKKCPKPNQIWSSNGNHPCQNTCESPTFSTVCSYSAGNYSGCICKNGYLKNAAGVCIVAKLCTDCVAKPNEIYSECNNHPCQNTCANPNLSAACDYAGCFPGCICSENYLRNDNGECVYKDDCPPPTPQCPAGEEYLSCGTACPITCENAANPPTVCTRNCVPGCFCKEGLIRDTVSGQCVAPDDCTSPICPDPNEKYYGCKPCRYTCENPSFACAAVCIAGCSCKEGYIRQNNQNSTCVPETSCPQCPSNEEYKSCGTACPTTCNNKDNPPTVCTKNCVEGCFCKDGYVRDEESGNCVQPDQCPVVPQCDDPNSEYLRCKRCVGSCDNKNPICNRSCNPPGCYCKRGYIKRSSTDPTCIKESECVSCPENEEYDTCGTACPKTCKNKNRDPFACTKNCVEGCFCKDGYVRNEDSGKCVLPNKCPVDPKPAKCKRNEVWLKKCAKYQDTCQKSYNPELGTKPGCCCKEGYVREFTGGRCIRRRRCYKHRGSGSGSGSGSSESDEHWD